MKPKKTQKTPKPPSTRVKGQWDWSLKGTQQNPGTPVTNSLAHTFRYKSTQAELECWSLTLPSNIKS